MITRRTLVAALVEQTSEDALAWRTGCKLFAPGTKAYVDLRVAYANSDMFDALDASRWQHERPTIGRGAREAAWEWVAREPAGHWGRS